MTTDITERIDDFRHRLDEASGETYDSKKAALDRLGRPDSENQWLVTAPDGTTSAVYGRTPAAAVSTALNNRGKRETLKGDVVHVADKGVAGRWDALGYDGRTQQVAVVHDANMRGEGV